MVIGRPWLVVPVYVPGLKAGGWGALILPVCCALAVLPFAVLIFAETLTLSVLALRRALAPHPRNRTSTASLSPAATESLTTPKLLPCGADPGLRAGAVATVPLAVQAVTPIGQLTLRPVSTTIECRFDLVAFGLPVTDAFARPEVLGAG